jgi:hypothetical protein
MRLGNVVPKKKKKAHSYIFQRILNSTVDELCEADVFKCTSHKSCINDVASSKHLLSSDKIPFKYQNTKLCGAQHSPRGHELCNHPRNFQNFMELEGSLARSQELSTCLNP